MSNRDRMSLEGRLKRARRSLSKMHKGGLGDSLKALELSWLIHDLEGYLDEAY